MVLSCFLVSTDCRYLESYSFIWICAVQVLHYWTIKTMIINLKLFFQCSWSEKELCGPIFNIFPHDTFATGCLQVGATCIQGNIVARLAAIIVSISGAISWGRYDEKFTLHAKFRNEVCSVSVSPLTTVGDVRKAIAHAFGLTSMENMLILKVGTRSLRDMSVMMGVALPGKSVVHIIVPIQGGVGSSVHSIPVDCLRELLTTIESDFEEWVRTKKPIYKKRYPGDPMEGKYVVWDGLSGAIKYFFEAKSIKPFEKYQKFYSSKNRTISVSYVWAKRSLYAMAGEAETLQSGTVFSVLWRNLTFWWSFR